MIVPQPPPAAVAFVDARHGWAGGSGGLLGTTDGRRFRVEIRAPVVGISALDRRHAWAITGDGFVLRTLDGQRWTRLGTPHLFGIQFVTRRTGFGLTRDGAVVRSVDAGQAWPQLATPGLMQAECFASPRDGWVARAGTVWTTHDGGGSWARTKLQRARQGSPDPQLGCNGGDVWVVFHEGAAASTEGYRVYRSRDGGSTWRAVFASPFQNRLPSISNYAGPFRVLGAGAAILSGYCSPCDSFGTASFVRTLDGGATWRKSTPLRGYTPEALSFVDANRGWLVTGAHVASATAVHHGVLWRTVDGGRSWRIVLRSPQLAP